MQPATRRRYNLATDAFLQFLKDEQLVLPKQRNLVDPILCDYLEHLWASGAGRGQACDTLAGLQDMQPNLRNHLPGAWRLLKTWSINEIPCRAPPLPEHLVQAMAGWAFLKGHNSFAISLLIGFYSMLRTGEVLGLCNNHMLSDARDSQILISLGLTKGGKRHGAAESVVLGYEPVVLLVQRWKSIAKTCSPLVPSAPKWRALFNECLEALGISDHQFRPYSLRRGGATFWFSRHQSLDRILVQGRWHTQKSARLYLNEGLAVLATMRLPRTDPRINPFLTHFLRIVRTRNFQTLEPPAVGGRAGGRGKRLKNGQKKRQKALFWWTRGAIYFFIIGTSLPTTSSCQEVWLGKLV